MKQAWFRLKACGTQATTLHLQHLLSVVHVPLPADPVVVSIELELHFTGRFTVIRPPLQRWWVISSHFVCLANQLLFAAPVCIHPSLSPPTSFPLPSFSHLPYLLHLLYSHSPPLSLPTQISVRWTVFVNRFRCSHKREQMCTRWRKGISLLWRLHSAWENCNLRAFTLVPL